MLIQILFSVRSERQLVEQLDYNILFRWFVGLGMDDRVWDHSTFSNNRDRLLAAALCRPCCARSMRRRCRRGWCPPSISRSTEHCSMRGQARRAQAEGRQRRQ